MSIIDLKVPSIGESITEVTLAKWLKQEGEMVQLDEAICEFESDKATLEFPAEVAGKLIRVAKEGDDLAIGAIVARIDTSAKASIAKEEKIADEPVKVEKQEAATISVAPEKQATKSESDSYAKGHPSPAANKILAEKNILPDSIAGSGRDGRITKEDAEKASSQSPATEPKDALQVTVSETPSTFSRNTRTEKMSRMRRTIAKRLVSAKNNTAMLTTFNEVDLTEIMAMRSKYQDAFVKKNGIKLGFMSIFAKACAKVLLEMPEVNAQILDEELIYHDYADISIAISTPTGLVVPPIKNVESLSFAQIEQEVKVLAEKARGGKLTLEEMSGGTFTITNGGVFGSMMSTPIINEPQSAILGMHAILERAMVIKGEIKIRPMMYLALSYDHRVIDGSSSVTFLVRVKNLLEDPSLLLLDL
ncbi:MAG: 2-oxoglutarate dehydrogenase complex dihydrolipoyllysine-residue succinyltransferase [Saprospiraceae bacterium]